METQLSYKHEHSPAIIQPDFVRMFPGMILDTVSVILYIYIYTCFRGQRVKEDKSLAVLALTMLYNLPKDQ